MNQQDWKNIFKIVALVMSVLKSNANPDVYYADAYKLYLRTLENE